VLLDGYEAPSFKRRGIDLPKPKGMHRRTYDRLANRHQADDNLCTVALWRRWGRRIH
jgi:hypothetical protein